jgi:hypothetical protein
MSHPSELQIQLDDVYACPGNCGGCVLAAAERRVQGADMSDAVREGVIARLEEYVKARPRLDRLNITWGIADHLLMEDEYIAALYRDGCRVVRAADPVDRDHSAVFFTTALIGKEERVMPRLEKLAGLWRDEGIRFIPVAVMDPGLARREGFGPKYRGMILETRRLFGKVDLSVNLADDIISSVAPEELHDFAADNGFDELTLNWVPTLGNLDRTAGGMEALGDWLIRFDAHLSRENRISSSFRPVILRVIDSVMCKSDGQMPGYAEAAAALIPESFRRSIQIDHEGHLMPKFEAIGDVPQNPRFGYPDLGNVLDTPLMELLEREIPVVTRRAIAAHANTRACADCTFAGFCAATGFHVVNHVLRKSGHDEGRAACPHVGQRLFRHFYDVASAREAAE